MKENEQVLVFPAHILYGFNFSDNKVLKGGEAIDAFKTIMNSGQLSYIDRKGAETNPSYKQLIPYCMISYDDKVFTYQRTKKGGEDRLHDLYSLGVGGHINPEDGEDLKEGYVSYFKAMERELAEEVALPNNEYQHKMVGLLYDSSNEVGRVHFGVVHQLVFKAEPKLESPDPALTNGEFHDRVWLLENKDKFENWSKLVIENIL